MQYVQKQNLCLFFNGVHNLKIMIFSPSVFLISFYLILITSWRFNELISTLNLEQRVANANCFYCTGGCIRLQTHCQPFDVSIKVFASRLLNMRLFKMKLGNSCSVAQGKVAFEHIKPVLHWNWSVFLIHRNWTCTFCWGLRVGKYGHPEADVT